ncbi:hypothetical protein [Salsipaludibacter albus]|uniref:hypothetical protein n=1 Tax=Salsipaludibacter albus TaxID=2849650 RepID=UPI001EE3A42D|nr:hypothetical protein [Salsipaludibacter albus]MBY5161681.1 hypothetical protein [Salsipaludibacter albus]
MTDRRWYHVHPALGCQPLPAGETAAPMIGEAELPQSWVDLDDDEQDAQEVAFFTRAIGLAVGAHASSWIRGHVQAVDCGELDLDDPLDERLDLLFAVAAPTSLEILANGRPVVRIGCDWAQAAALLAPPDLERLPAWTSSAPRLSTGPTLAGHDADVVDRHRRRHHKRDPSCPACPVLGDVVVSPSLLDNPSDPYDPIRVGDEGVVTSMDRAAGLLPLRIFDTHELIVDFGTGRWAQCGPNHVLKVAKVADRHS